MLVAITIIALLQREKIFEVSVKCKELNALNDSVLITIPPVSFSE